ncbi:pentapeptide repeat-containing protein [Donghicola mangrovi]|uniref:Pentapeptide repeat-containing protein n=1 Tax=Donghicola mangrovi TaxID=2729614 RepID=A0A850Q6Z5_9RHOB|nr:pentapeptide repeat-containing protein [Donghicola mangrovi]NVO24896.1 pentapeptide repeat-containing protein [Donghicola mangrovi]
MPPSRLSLRRIRNRQARSSQPEATDAQIARIDALTATGRTNWFALLAYLAFVIVTTLGVEDVDFFVDSRQTQLPIVGVSIPTFSFFIFAPVLGAALYVYLHLHIRKVTEALGKPPLGPPPLLDGTPIETHIKPWLLNDFVLRQRRDGAVSARPLDTLSWLTTWALVWFAGPFVLGLMWWRGWPAHNLLMSAINALCLMVAIYASALSWTKMRSDAGRRMTPGVIFTSAVCGLLCLPVAWLTAANSKGIAEWVIAYDKSADGSTRTWAERQEAWVRNKSDDPERTIYDKIRIWSWDNGTELLQLDSPDLSEAPLSVLPPEHADLNTARHRYRVQWCQRYGLTPEVCGGNPVNSDDTTNALWQARQTWCAETGLTDCGTYFAALEDDFTKREWPAYRSSVVAYIGKPNLSGKDLRAAILNNADLSGVDFGGANLKLADLKGGNLERANLSEANMDGAELDFAKLTGANLGKAKMKEANLSHASMEGANFSGADMEKAVITLANLEGADLSWAYLEKVNFSEANLEEAKFEPAYLAEASFEGARMERASFRGAYLEGADLGFSHMEGANFSGAKMKGAYLDWAHMEMANFSGADLERATLDHAKMEGAVLNLSALIGTEDEPLILEYTDLRAVINTGGALRFVDLRPAIFDADTDFRNSFGDATATLPDNVERPCQWASERLSHAEFYARWKGWLEAAPSRPVTEEGNEKWDIIAPDEWKEVVAAPPPTGCSWHE